MKHFAPRIVIVYLFILAGCRSGPEPPFIAVNQVGYGTNASKDAFLVHETAEEFWVVDIENQNVAYRGEVLSHRQADPATGDSLSVLSFTGFNRPGDYYLQIPGHSEWASVPFRIDDDIYSDALRTVLQGYFYNRCGTDVNNGEEWKHTLCHLDDAVFYDDPLTSRNVTGGWHDAGDYNKFSINTVLSAALLLNLYELRPGYFTDSSLNIPEAGNRMPDILDEIKWALEWLLKMQNYDGGVFHKVSQKKWVGETLPDKDTEPRYIFRISSNATAGFAALAAMSARLYKPYDAIFADALEHAAFSAWEYLEDHPMVQPLGGFKNPPDVSGGEYGDFFDTDERLWAAAELYNLSGEPRFLNYFTNHFRRLNIRSLPPLSWRDFHSIALSSFLKSSLPDTHQHHQSHILKEFQLHADDLLKKYERNNYRVLLKHTEYYWGSNSVNLGHAFFLIQLYRHIPREDYYLAALDQVHYTLGRNPFDQTFVTGLGNRPVRHPYYQFSMEAGHSRPVPGMMVGGPNYAQHLNGKEISSYPGKNYEDSEKNFFVNEVAINFTAVFAYVVGFFSIHQQEIKKDQFQFINTPLTEK